jgi:hypothetical protein
MREVKENAHSAAACALIHVDCLAAADAPNGLICIGQQLAFLSPIQDSRFSI